MWCVWLFLVMPWVSSGAYDWTDGCCLKCSACGWLGYVTVGTRLIVGGVREWGRFSCVYVQLLTVWTDIRTLILYTQQDAMNQDNEGNFSLGCVALLSDISLPTFRRYVLPPSLCNCTSFSTVGLLFHPENGSSVFLRNVGNLLKEYTQSLPRIQLSSYSPSLLLLLPNWTLWSVLRQKWTRKAIHTPNGFAHAVSVRWQRIL
jgi:hypothetical protein